MSRVDRVCLIGGSGFVGRHVAERLAARGVRVIIPTRNRERAKADLIVLPSVELVNADVNDPAQLSDLVAGCDAVVNLVGILHEGRSGDFRRAHVLLTEHCIAACVRHGVHRYLHMSALGAGPSAPSEYQRTKGEAEQRVMAAHAAGLATTIFRPSVIFGDGDSFLTLFARLLALAPFVPLGSPDARFQPVWVGPTNSISGLVRDSSSMPPMGPRSGSCRAPAGWGACGWGGSTSRTRRTLSKGTSNTSGMLGIRRVSMISAFAVAHATSPGLCSRSTSPGAAASARPANSASPAGCSGWGGCWGVLRGAQAGINELRPTPRATADMAGVRAECRGMNPLLCERE